MFWIFPRAYNRPVGPALQPDKDPSDLNATRTSGRPNQRLLIHKVDVKYPGIARAARIYGTVILQAAITKNGEISDVRPLCGPKILQEACIKAVRKWKYRPYLLNGEPVELETTITSVFSLGDPK
jgi:TonB family protein